jgi:hypothetical protein
MFFVAARNGKIRCFVLETSPCAILQGRPKIRACVRAMEKFRVFTDEAVGVNPFVQQPYKSSLTRNVVGALLLVVRVPLLAVIVPLLVASNIVGSALPGLPGRLTRAVLERFFARLVLLVMGFTSLPSTSPHRQAVRLRPSPSRPTQTVRGGDVLVAPSSSYIDVLYASAAYAPVFAFPCAASSSSSSSGGGGGGGGAGLLEVVGLVEALRRTLRPAHGSSASSGAHPSSSGGGVSAAARALQAAAAAHAPLLVFPEGAPTNNNALLEFSSTAEDVADAVRQAAAAAGAATKGGPTAHVLALRYGVVRKAGGAGGTVGAFSPSYVAGNPRQHLVRLLMQPTNALTCIRLPDGFDPQPRDFAAAAAGAAPPDATTATWGGAVRDAMAQLLDVRPVRLAAKDHAAFVRAWGDVASGGGGGGGEKKAK